MHRRLPALALLGLLLAPAWAHGQITELKFAAFPPPSGALVADVLGPWTKEVNEALKGTVNVRLFPGGTLGRDPVQQYKLVRDRVVDIAYVVQGYTPGDFPDATILDLPFLVESSLEGSVAHWRMHERGLMRGYDKAKILGLFAIPPQSIHTNVKVTKIDDIKGLKIRSAGTYQSAAIELLGATPVSGIPVPQAAEALSRGVVQGILSDWNGMHAFRIVDATKHHYEVPIGTAAAGIFMNLDAFNALPQAAKAAIDSRSNLVLSRLHGVEFDKRYNENIEKTKKDKDHSFVFPTQAERQDIKRRLQPITDRWVQENPDGRKRYDTFVSLVEDIRKGR